MFKIDEALKNNSNLWSLDENNRLVFSYKDDLLAEYQDLFKSLFADINLDPSTAQGQLITSLVQTDLATISLLESLANAFYFGGSGYFLDLWAWNLYRVKRKSEVPSKVVMSINGVPGTEVPEGFTVSDGTNNYKVSQAFNIPSSGEASAIFYDEIVSEHVAAAHTITQIVTSIDGVERVNNDLPADPAILRETDSELFNRCLYFGSTATNASFRSILANVAQVEGVSRVAGAENPSNTEVTIKGVELSPHSILVVADGGSDIDVATAIFNSRATGCDMVGSTEVSLYIDNQEYVYKFDRPILVPLQAKVSVSSKESIIRSDFVEVVRSELSKFIGSLDIAQTVTQPLLANALVKSIKDLNIDDVQFSLKDGVLGYSTVELKLNEAPSIKFDDITVEQS